MSNYPDPYSDAWEPFCGNRECPCMEPNVTGPCEEYKNDGERRLGGNKRCIECGWPKARHLPTCHPSRSTA